MATFGVALRLLSSCTVLAIPAMALTGSQLAVLSGDAESPKAARTLRGSIANDSNYEASQARPLGQRHIQYLWMGHAGIGDRLKIFTWLVGLGEYHNAMTHIPGGSTGAHNFLGTKHSDRISSDWTLYVNVNANDGNPFHKLIHSKRCHQITDPETNFKKLFDAGHMCVNIVNKYFDYKYPEIDFFTTGHKIPPSDKVMLIKNQFLEWYEVPEDYGIIHIRRCDRLQSNMMCTNPERVQQEVAKHPHLKVWMVFMYAEEGYSELLKKQLRPMADRRFLFEDELELNPHGDNYFTYMVIRELLQEATVKYDTHHCHDSSDGFKPGFPASMPASTMRHDQTPETFEFTQLGALCSDERGEMLL